MEEGYIVDISESNFLQSKWIPGEPEASFWTENKIDKNKLIPVTTFRCISCGYLDSCAKNQTDLTLSI
jgi:hypothetical protein